ncbi:MAG: hypothetical protein ACK4K6_17425, partial [Pseudarthrobacter sp.]
VALEAHLAGCSGCRAEIEALQATWASLDVIPEVVPPPDGAWQVIQQLRQHREAQEPVAPVATGARQQQEWRPEPAGVWPAFMQWLRTLSPASAAMGGALATLIIGGMFVATNQPHGKMGFLPGNARPAAVRATMRPSVSVAHGRMTPAGQEVNVRVTPVVTLTGAQVQVNGGGIQFTHAVSGDLSVARPLELTVPVQTAGKRAEAFRVSLDAKPTGYQGLIVVPLGGQQDQGTAVSLTVVEKPAEEVLRQLVPHVGASIVVDGAASGVVTLQVAEAAPRDVLAEIADQLSMDLTVEGGVFRLTAR